MVVMIIKVAVFWDVAPCSLVEIDRRLDVLTASIIILHGATSQKTAIFTLVAVRT
jgi:hypothetical protein